MIDAIQTLQDYLGDLNDAQIAINLIQSYEKRVKKSKRKALKVYRKHRKAEAKQLRATFPEVWSQFKQHNIQQALVQSIAEI